MAYSGKIYVADHEGMPVGIGQTVTVLAHNGGFAAFLSTDDGNVRISDPFQTEDACVTNLKGGGTTVVIDDDV